jgi:hypothetical protein
LKKVFDSDCVRQSVTCRRVRARGFGKQPCLSWATALKPSLNAAMQIAEPNVQILDHLTEATESKVSGLDDPGVYGADRDLENALAVNGQKAEIARPEITVRKRVFRCS